MFSFYTRIENPISEERLPNCLFLRFYFSSRSSSKNPDKNYSFRVSTKSRKKWDQIRPSFCFCFCFFFTVSTLRSFQLLFLSLIGRFPTYFPSISRQARTKSWKITNYKSNLKLLLILKWLILKSNKVHKLSYKEMKTYILASERNKSVAFGFIGTTITNHLCFLEAWVLSESLSQQFIRDLIS